MIIPEDIYQPCPCASGKKYKFCCYQKDRELAKSAKCGLCGRTGAIRKTECCGRWICDDEDSYQLFSFARNSCSRNHRNYTLCGAHEAGSHQGRWQNCAECREDLETEIYVWKGTNEYNFEKLANPPTFEPTRCNRCKRLIVLAEDAYSQRGDNYFCEKCTSKLMQESMNERKIKSESRSGFVSDVERVWADWLGREWSHANEYYQLNLFRPQIVIENSQNKLGTWDPVTQTISISVQAIKQYPWHVVVEILKHEMAHQYVSEFAPIEEKEHGPHFRRACELMGLPDWARSATGDLPNKIPDWRTASLTEEEKRLLDKTNKLLALAQSDNEHEAQLAMQRVRELYAKYNLDQIEKRREARVVSWVLNFKSKRIEGWQSLILGLLNKHFFVQTISFSQFDPIDLVEYKAAEIIGKKENVVMAEYVYQFLERTIHALWEKHLNAKPSLADLKHATLRSEKRHFFIGVLHGFREQLDQTNGYQNLGRTESECKSLVNTADSELSEFFRRKYPRTSTRTGGGFNPDRDTYKSGVNEGQKIRLHKPVTGQEGNRGKLLTS